MQNVTKKSLSAFDDKRKYINNIESVPYGYCWKKVFL